MSETWQTKRRIGHHELWYESDTGFIGVVHVGELDKAAAVAWAEYFVTCVKNSGQPAFVIVDDRKATGMTSEARRIIVDSELVRSDFHVAGFGMTFTYRAFINFFSRALALAGSKVVVKMMSDEAMAREWLTERRRAHLAELSLIHI